MRTQEEIVQRYEAVKADDVLGFRSEVLLLYLDFEHAKPYLKPDVTAESWNADVSKYDRDAVLEAAAKYMVFAWGKVKDHRGISASRSVDKMTEYAWLLGEDALVEEIGRTGYAQYGAPPLKLICEKLGFPLPDDEPTKRMMRGEPCCDGCQEGCGR